MGFTKFGVVGVVLAEVILVGSLWAFDTSVVNDVVTLGSNQQTTITVINTESKPIAIEVTPVKRQYTREGVEKFDGETSDVVAIPSQMILNPGEEQVVALRWVGPVTIDKEHAFRILVENVPIELSTTNVGQPAANRASGQIRMVYRIVKSFYVQPPGATSRLKVVSAQFGVDPKKNKTFDLVMTNDGSAHEIVRRCELDVTLMNPSDPSANAIVMPAKFDSQDLSGGVNFLVDEERLIQLPVPKTWQVPKGYQPVSAVFRKSES